MTYIAIKFRGKDVLVPEAWLDALYDAGLLEYTPSMTGYQWRER